MKKHNLKALVAGIFVATALAFVVGVGAQTPPSPGSLPAAESPQATPMTGHHEDMKPECQAMMAKKQEMQDKAKAMDVALDKLVAEMNAAHGSKKTMVAVINELVAQRKARHSMMMEMQPAMMAHMMHHMDMHGTKGAMECPMMKSCNPAAPKAEDQKPKM